MQAIASLGMLLLGVVKFTASALGVPALLLETPRVLKFRPIPINRGGGPQEKQLKTFGPAPELLGSLMMHRKTARI